MYSSGSVALATDVNADSVNAGANAVAQLDCCMLLDPGIVGVGLV